MAVVALAACCPQTPEPAPIDLSGLEEIRIDYEHYGWGSTEEHFVITPDTSGQGFALRGDYSSARGRTVPIEMSVPDDAVATFLRHLSEPPWSRSRGIQGVVQRVNKATLRQFEPVTRVPPSRCSDDELQMLARRHLHGARLTELADNFYGDGITWTDDYPSIQVQIRWREKSVRMISSQSQKARMLPWNLGVPKRSPSTANQNWSLPLSESLRALLPPVTEAHQRLDGMSRMEQELNQNALWHAERECDALRATRQEGRTAN